MRLRLTFLLVLIAAAACENPVTFSFSTGGQEPDSLQVDAVALTR